MSQEENADYWYSEAGSAIGQIHASNPYRKAAFTELSECLANSALAMPDIAVEVEEYDDEEVESAVKNTVLAS
jgi:hypothetical protein